MRSFTQLAVVAALLLQSPIALADDVITNVMSPVVSFQYPDDFSSQALTNGGIHSRVVSYQYMEWPGDDVLQLQSSPRVSYYYQFLDAPPLVIVPTNRTPIAPEITPPEVFPRPYPQQLKTFVNGVLTSNTPNPTKMTIVLTHGWNSNPDVWATNMATELSLHLAGSPNILIWDWKETAAADLCNSGQFVAPARHTPEQGFALGQALFSKLGPTYANRIHFIGHSLGALVNGHAATWIHDQGFAPTNTHLTLLDEAEVGTDLSCVELLQALVFNQWNPFAAKAYYYRPLPPKFGWADNYITAFGLLHPDAHNVILTNGFPAIAGNLVDFGSRLSTFHGYPCAWYNETIITDVSDMGHRWSFERNGFAGAPPTNTVFLQSFNGSLWNLAQTNYEDASKLLEARLAKYRKAAGYDLRRTLFNVIANGTASGLVVVLADYTSTILYLKTASPAPQAPQNLPLGVHSKNAGVRENGGAYAWLPLSIPADAVWMSFDFKIEGDWENDSLAAAMNGTNVLLLAASEVEASVTLNSGLFDVTRYAGKTNELFVGIIGGTSTNAILTVQNVMFHAAAQPLLVAQSGNAGIRISWPLTAQAFRLESTTNLMVTNSWTSDTNVPAVVDLENTVTNSTSGGARFYRLRK